LNGGKISIAQTAANIDICQFNANATRYGSNLDCAHYHLPQNFDHYKAAFGRVTSLRHARENSLL
jgi:hypothetical protein